MAFKRLKLKRVVACLGLVRAATASTPAASATRPLDPRQASAPLLPVCQNQTNPVNLVYISTCTSNSGSIAELNTGIDLSRIKTVVAFGDSWTANGGNGSVTLPPIQYPPIPSAGGYHTRAANGFEWVENLANAIEARHLNYAFGGAVITLAAWNTTRNYTIPGQPETYATVLPGARSSFVSQVAWAQQQLPFALTTSPDETLYTIAFGINDRGQYGIGGGDWSIATAAYIAAIDKLRSSVGASQFLIHGAYRTTPAEPLAQLQASVLAHLAGAPGAPRYAYADMAALYGAIGADPVRFGFSGAGPCLADGTLASECSDPALEVYYFSGHPSATSHRLMSEYTIDVVNRCRRAS